MPMFSNDIKITGKHAEIMQKYSRNMGTDNDISFIVKNNDGEDKDIYIFKTRIYCYMVAAMLGIINQKQAEPDNDTRKTATIFAAVITSNKENRNLLYRIYNYMILCEKNKNEIDTKVKSAFSNIPEDKVDQETAKLENYVRGGLEIIDKTFSKCKTYEDVLNKIFELKEVFSLDI